MDLREMIRTGVRSLSRHKLWTLLTMLGVIFGVAAVISMMSIGEGARRAAIEQIKLLGTNNIRVTRVDLPVASRAWRPRKSSPRKTSRLVVRLRISDHLPKARILLRAFAFVVNFALTVRPMRAREIEWFQGPRGVQLRSKAH